MIYHNIYKSWAWTGGHADGESNLLGTAIRELKEETGVEHVKALDDNIFSLEIICVNGHVKKRQVCFFTCTLEFDLSFRSRRKRNIKNKSN